MLHYFVFPKLTLDPNDELELRTFDWTRVKPAYHLTRTSIALKLLTIWQEDHIPPWKLIQQYGFLFERIGNFRTVHVPDHVVQSILNQWVFLQEMPEKPIIKLQILYGGECVPIHVDRTRSTSLIYPINNHTATTNFYDLQKELTGRALVDPTTCLLNSSVIIGQHPVLLDVDCPHDITYKRNSITFSNPRISLNLKWSDMKIQQVLKYFNLYA